MIFLGVLFCNSSRAEDKSAMQQKVESLESQVDVLKKTLNTAEKSNEQLQEENRRASEKCNWDLNSDSEMTLNKKTNKTQLEGLL